MNQGEQHNNKSWSHRRPKKEDRKITLVGMMSAKYLKMEAVGWRRGKENLGDTSENSS